MKTSLICLMIILLAIVISNYFSGEEFIQFIIEVCFQPNIFTFCFRSLLGILLVFFWFWRPSRIWGNILRQIFLLLTCLVGLPFLLLAVWNFIWSWSAIFESILLFLATIFWPLGLGYIWRWNPVNSKQKWNRIFCFIGIGIFVGMNAWLPVFSIIRDINTPCQVKRQKISPEGKTIATVFYLSDGETFVNLRPRWMFFVPVDISQKDGFGENPNNVMHLRGYHIPYISTDFQWIDETHLKILVSGFYYQLSDKGHINGMGRFGQVFEKKLDHWRNIEIIYGNK